MVKKIGIIAGALVAAVVLFIVIAGIIIMVKIDKSFIESRMSKVLNRQVHIEKIDVSIFSIVSGIEVRNIAVSNFKSPQQLDLLKDKPVPAGDVFVNAESLRFKVSFLPLLRGQFVLKELVLYTPVINLAKSKQGVMNCDDLIKSKKTEAIEKADPKEKKTEKADLNKKIEAEIKEQAKPFTADDIPLAVIVGQLGIKNGIVNYYDSEFDQKFQIYKLTALAYDINIDPKDLEKKNEIKLKIAMGIKNTEPMKTGSVHSFNITFDATGKVIPFDMKTRQLEPEVIIHAGFPDGEITGLQIFSALAAIPLLGDYLGEYISFLRGKLEWKNSKESYVDLAYKAGKLGLSNGNLDLKETRFLFAGSINTDSKAIDTNLEMVMKKEINDAVKAALAKKIDAGIKNPEVKKYADSGKLAEAAMKPLLNKDNMIDTKFNVSGTTRKPDVKLVQPQLDSLDSVIKKSAGSILMEAGKSAGKQLLGEGQKKVMESLPGLFKK